MQRTLTLFNSSIGKKALMATSGVVLLGFTLGHLLGNMKVYAGPEEYNEYARWLRTVPLLLWGTRFALLICFGAHIWSAFALWKRNNEARSSRYMKNVDLATDYAAKTMYYSGPILLFYVAFHLLHLTFGGMIFGDANLLGIEGYTWEVSNPYNNMVRGFQHWPIVIPYVLGVLALGVHLFHGIWSMFQTIGANHPKYNPFRRDIAIGIAALLTIGNLSFPIAVYFGYLEPTTLRFNFPELH